MALTSEDLQNISNIVDESVNKAGLATKSELKDAIAGLATKSELKEVISGLALKSDLDRMEARIVTAINLLQRDTYTRLDDHEARIRRLEQTSSR